MSLDTLVSGITGNLGTRFNLVGLIPGVILFLFLLGLVFLWSEPPSLSPNVNILIEKFKKTDTQEAILILILILIFALIAQPLQLPLVRFFEGYWDTSTIGKKFNNLGKDIQWEKRERYKQIIENRELDRKYPTSYKRLLPTSLGNILRAAEDIPRKRYGLETVVIWSRLYPILPETMRAILDDKRNQMDIAIRLCSIFLICAFASIIFYFIIVYSAISNSFPLNFAIHSAIFNSFPLNIVYFFMFLLKYSLWLIISIVVLMLAWLSYNSAKTVALSYGKAIEAAFDLYRFDLLKSLHLSLPKDSKIERSSNELLTNIFLGYYEIVTYNHGDNDHTSSSKSPISDMSIVTNKDTHIEITLKASNPQSTNNLIFYILDLPSHGSLHAGSTPNTVKYTPNEGYTGSDRFTYVAKNEDIISDKITVNISINNVKPLNIPPKVRDITIKTLTNKPPIDIKLISNDTSQNSNFLILSKPKIGDLILTDINRGVVKYTPNKNTKNTIDSFTYKATEQNGLDSNIGNVKIIIISPFSFVKRYAFIILGLVLIAIGILISGYYLESLAGSSSIKQLLENVNIMPNKSINVTMSIDNNKNPVVVAIYPQYHSNTTGVIPRISVLNTEEKSIALDPFKGPFVVKFQPILIGNYTLIIFNSAQEMIIVDASFGYIKGQENHESQNIILGIISGIIIIFLGLIAIIAGFVFAINEIISKACLTKNMSQ